MIAATLLSLCLAAAPAPPAHPPAAAAVLQAADELARGRELLASGDVEAALALFEAADERSGGALETRVWVLRAWIELERFNDALDAIDGLAKSHEGPAIDYLYGMAFARKASSYVAKGLADASVGMHYADAVRFLQGAVEADPGLYSDAIPELAQAALRAGELELARATAERALEASPENADLCVLLGDVAYFQYAEAQGGDGAAAGADAHWQASKDAFERALALGGESDTGAARARAAKARWQIGNLHLWKRDVDAAAEAMGAALGLDPTIADLGQLWGQLGAGPFREAMHAATESHAERFGADDPGDAELQWWLGYASLHGDPPDAAAAEEALLRSVRENPEYVNAWYWAGHARYAQEDWAGAAEAFARHFELDPAGLIATVRAAKESDVPRLDWLVGAAASEGRVREAAALAEVCAEVVQTEPRHWNNAGLFWRDWGDRLRASDADPSEEELEALWRKAHRCYQRALSLSPEDPVLLNDTAVMLDYYLEEDLEKALAMYERARGSAERMLAEEELDEETRGQVEIALRDARNNHARLSKRLAGEDEGAGAEKGGGGAGTGDGADAGG